MNRLTCALVTLAAVPMTLALVPTASKPEEVGLSSERLHRIHEAVQRHVDAKEVSTLASQLFGDWKSPKPFARVPSVYKDVPVANQSFPAPD